MFLFNFSQLATMLFIDNVIYHLIIKHYKNHDFINILDIYRKKYM